MTLLRTSSRRLFEAFRERTRPDPDDVDACLMSLGKLVAARYPPLAGHDAEEIASDAITALFEAARTHREIAEPAGWMRRVVRNASYDRWKALQRTTPSEDPIGDSLLPDEAEYGMLHLLDALSDKLVVKRALRAAFAEDDTTVVRTIGAWLAIHEQTGEIPSVRAVAARAEVSPSGVAKTLIRFARYLRRFDGDEI